MSLFARFHSIKHLADRSWFPVFFAGLLFLLGALLWRNPFSVRTLIPNFEPFPDSFHYLVPLRSFLSGSGFLLTRPGIDASTSPQVPPLYSFFLLPFFLIKSDPRIFYLGNVLLAFVSLGLLEYLFRKLRFSAPVRFTLDLFLVLNFYFSWVPVLAMAENLLFPFMILGMLMLVLPVSRRHVILAGFLTWVFYATKYAAAPITVVFFFAYILKILHSQKKKVAELFYSRLIWQFVLTNLIAFGLLSTFQYLQRGTTPLLSLLQLVLAMGTPLQTESSPTGLQSFFSLEFLPAHLPAYIQGSLGKTYRFLWEQTPLLPLWQGILGVTGLLLAISRPKTRFLASVLLVLFLAQVLFISSFYVVDMRYVYHLLPILLVGLGYFLQTVGDFLHRREKAALHISLLFIALWAGTFLAEVPRLRKQVVLNLRYAETPWYYLAVQQANTFFSRSDGERVFLISPMSPYLFDFFPSEDFRLLPLSEEQDHSWPTGYEKLWGPGNYQDLPALYRQYLQEGHELYVMNYGLGNEAPLHADYERLKQEFDLELIAEGCYQLCNIYRVKMRE